MRKNVIEHKLKYKQESKYLKIREEYAFLPSKMKSGFDFLFKQYSGIDWLLWSNQPEIDLETISDSESEVWKKFICEMMYRYL